MAASTNPTLELAGLLLRVKELEEQHLAFRYSVICAFNQLLDLKDFFLPPVGHDSAPAHQYHPLDFRDDVSQLMRNQQDGRP